MANLLQIPRVLVVEDEALILLDVEQTLLDAGVETVLAATTVADALQLIDHAPPDAAILDLHLGRDGWSYDVARRLQEKGVPFVFSSGTVEVADGFHGVPLVLKPFASDQLIETLANACTQRDTEVA